MAGGIRLGMMLLVVVLAGAACSTSDVPRLGDQVPLLEGSDEGSGLRLVFDHPCPEGGPISIEIEETETEVVVTATVTDGQLIDCDGGSASSDVSTTSVGLDDLLRDRTVIDGSTGEAVPVTRITGVPSGSPLELAAHIERY